MNRDSRRAPRRTPDRPIVVHDCMTAAVIGQIGNVSASGLLLLAHAPLALDALYQLQFVVPGENAVITVGAQAIWVDDRGGQSLQPTVWTGMRFISIVPRELALLRAWTEAG